MKSSLKYQLVNWLKFCQNILIFIFRLEPTNGTLFIGKFCNFLPFYLNWSLVLVAYITKNDLAKTANHSQLSPAPSSRPFQHQPKVHLSSQQLYSCRVLEWAETRPVKNHLKDSWALLCFIQQLWALNNSSLHEKRWKFCEVLFSQSQPGQPRGIQAQLSF